MANEKAKNNLESYIFETQAWLEVEEVIAVSSEEQREEIRAAIREVYDWFEEEGYYSAETKVSLYTKYTHALVNMCVQLTGSRGMTC